MAIGEISNDFLPIVATIIPGPDSEADDLVFELSLVSYDPEESITLKFVFDQPL